MPPRRILSLWFPRLGAERLMRQRRGLPAQAFAVVIEQANLQTLWSLNAEAEAEGLRQGQPLRDARAMCPELLTHLRNAQAEALFLMALRRWAGKFSPWVAEEPPEGLVIDLSGAAHLFGGEEGVLATISEDCAGLGLSVQAGIADTVGAAWALTRYAGRGAAMLRSGDAVDQEARATRSRAARRHWTSGGTSPSPVASPASLVRVAAPGQTRQALAPLPLAALRIDAETVNGLAKLGLRRIEDVMGMPRAALARRFGTGLVRRLDQALGAEAEPVSPSRPPLHFAVRLTLPDPIGLAEDIMAAIDRLLPALSERLVAKRQGARRIRLQLSRSDQSMQEFDLGLARPTADVNRLRPLLMLKLTEIDPGFGICMVRLEAHQTEPVHAHQHRGHFDASETAATRRTSDTSLEDLIATLGARIGMETITRLAPADSHVPEKAAKVLAAAWSEPTRSWPTPHAPRPLVLFRSEPVGAPEDPMPPASFRWRRRNLVTTSATGPERIAPEWWLDEPEWRSGTRDYWRIEVATGERLWLYYAHGGAVSGGWFCQGEFW